MTPRAMLRLTRLRAGGPTRSPARIQPQWLIAWGWVVCMVLISLAIAFL